MPRRKNNQQPLMYFVVAVVLIGSFFLLLSESPEQVRLVSDDGNIRVEAIAPRMDAINIDQLNTDPRLYAISVSREHVIQDAEITMAGFSDEEDLTELAIYAFNQSALVWDERPTIFNLQTRELSTQLDLSGSVLIRLDTRR